MMSAEGLSMENYSEEQQLQVITQFKTEEEPVCVEPSSHSPAAPENPMENDKQSIYRHPLFPLLALLFEKCEGCTQGSENTTSASFDLDIETFVRRQHKEGKDFFSDDPETDSLMVKAIQVLRIHLLELEKVNELCKDFCSRYISCLKTKMNMETLLSGEAGGAYSPIQSGISGALAPRELWFLPLRCSKETWQWPLSQVAPLPARHRGHTAGPIVAQALSPGTIRIQNSQLQLQLTQDLGLLHSDDGSGKNKRGVLPKQATNVMRSWLFQHIGHPYPTEEEKKQIAAQTNLTLLQVNNWFINARRRILQPMLDSSSAETPKAKKKSGQSRPVQRFWPDSIAGGTSQHGSDIGVSDGKKSVRWEI
ncbi:hypothetical protein GDO86_019903 [Hymenochirus boettgeri]|uniref:Homeobox domain-containing protein n=1 Tax=Hymenochirus boettgeri TaxID=247094 RepID=A0A8T2IJI0_9PIPI|nr:hypothetical protein GDO86_019903 [Hymenochirus boettgeri]